MKHNKLYTVKSGFEETNPLRSLSSTSRSNNSEGKADLEMSTSGGSSGIHDINSDEEYQCDDNSLVSESDIERENSENDVTEGEDAEVSIVEAAVQAATSVIHSRRKALQKITDFKRSRFADWNREELLELIVLNDFEIRDEANIATVSLRDWCDEYFKDQPMPEKPRLMTKAERERADYLVRKFHAAWIRNKHQKRRQQEKYELECQAKRMEQEFDFNGDDIDGDELGIRFGDTTSFDLGDIENQPILGIDQTLYELDSMAKTSTVTFEQVADEALRQSIRRPQSMKISNNIKKLLDSNWEQPSWELAQRSKDFFHPRRGGKGGALYDFHTTTTGTITVNTFALEAIMTTVLLYLPLNTIITHNITYHRSSLLLRKLWGTV
jgi:hypothetical protein